MKVLAVLLALSLSPAVAKSDSIAGAKAQNAAYYCTIIGGMRKCYRKKRVTEQRKSLISIVSLAGTGASNSVNLQAERNDSSPFQAR